MIKPSTNDAPTCTYFDVVQAAALLGLDAEQMSETVEIRITPGYVVVVRVVRNETGQIYNEALPHEPLATATTVIRVVGD